MTQAPGILLYQVTSVISTMLKSPYVILIWFRIVYSWSRKKKGREVSRFILNQVELTSWDMEESSEKSSNNPAAQSLAPGILTCILCPCFLV